MSATIDGDALRHEADALNRYLAVRSESKASEGPALQYDADGNLVRDAMWKYAWDGENRLLSVESIPAIPPGDRRRLEFVYDTHSRRVGKRVYGWEAARSAFSVEPSISIRCLYDGWNLIAELRRACPRKPGF